MRSAEKLIMILAAVAFVIAVGSGFFDVYIRHFEEGVITLKNLGELSTEALTALAAIVAAAVTLIGSSRGRKKRKR